ncbi:ATP-dependent DNA helicase Q4 [Cimex lectularius]|uniref:DNA 3'-5' helicase n=1 Tax=Cimex lectularius TaxID=79782 RepID=A0A8I6RHZ3_CIMLE|nr:ATP-dependent DNA helicase Q4 [Cimex lectularius]
MNTAQRREYDLAKYTVKNWESEFKRTTRSIPTKADIKCAPMRIKEAYKTYWKLKTLELENTLADVLNDENAKDCFNSSNEEINKTQNSLSEDSVCFTAISDNTTDSSFSLLNQSTESKIELLSRQIEEKERSLGKVGEFSFKNILKNLGYKNLDSTSNINTVWGTHLNKSQNEDDKDKGGDVKKLEAKSVSFKYTEKLFKGSKFNKRNPRKPLKKSKTIGAIEVKSNVEPVQEINDVLSEPLVTKEEIIKTTLSQPVEDNDVSFNLFNNKTKIVKSSCSASSTGQAVSLLQKKFDGDLKTKLSIPEIDKGWLERVNQINEITEIKKMECVSQDSGIELSQSHTLPDTLDKKSDSDEDLIYDSDTETNNSPNSSKCPLSLPVFNDSKPIPLKDIFQNNKRSLAEPDESISKKAKLDCYEFKLNTTKPEILAPVKRDETPKEVPLDVIVQKKLEQLEKKLNSGKANENFVAINIQKKVYARGKKKMTYSKYKKQKWKQMTKGGDMNSGGSFFNGVKKCFKCGDVGHYSKACPKAGKELLPLEEYESEDESPFPTLAEAAQIVEEAAEKAHSGKRRFTVSTESNIEEKKKTIISPPEEFINLEEELVKETIEPVYKLNDDGLIIDTPREVFTALKEFGHSAFLPGQEKAVMRILSGQSTLVTLSTGSGKSLCYQLPAYIYSKHYSSCITLVVSPLISLMDDQVKGINKCFKIASLHTNQTEKKRKAVLDEVKSGNVSILLISPETLVSLDSGFAKSLLQSLPPIAFACIDEAHCLYQWCHNFRPSYMTVTQVLREKLGVKTLLGLTATASTSTKECILSHLGLDPYDQSGVISDTPIPNNLILSVSLANSEDEKQQALLRLLNGKKFGEYNSIIIYCARREQCEKVASFLRTFLQNKDGKNNIGRMSIHAEPYHAGLTAGRRNQVQDKFMSGKLRIVVATMAFGMGIDKNDIRGIIHYTMPSTFENYVQEVGRAGRDQKPAHCHLFLDEKKHDLGELKRHIYSNTIDRHTIRKFLQLVFVPCKCKDECPKHEVAFPIEDTVTKLDLPQENISTLLAYLELDKKKWIKCLPLAYTRCKVTSYKGSSHLKKVARNCPPLTMAMALANQEGKDSKLLDFDIISLARNINWDSGIVKRTLYNLEWTKENDKPKKSGIIVDMNQLGFRVLSPGNLSDTELDEALDILHSTVEDQEKNSLYSLQVFYNALRKVAYTSLDECIDTDDLEKSDSLKNEIRGYFVNPNSIRNVELDPVSLENEGSIAADIRRLISLHRSDNNLTGRSIARILHGIGSPNFPPIIWGRTKFWRLHLNQDFNLLCKLATKQLILMR